jgi:type III secretory pathway component EscS
VLVVHAVVVLIPLAVLCAVVIAVWPAARHRYRWPVLGLTALATIFVPVATASGDGLEHSLPESALISAHTQLGDQLLPFAAALLLVVAGLVAVDRLATRTPAATPQRHGTATVLVADRTWVRPVALVLSVLTVVLGVVTAAQVVRIGDSGARAAWSDTQYVQHSVPGTGSS